MKARALLLGCLALSMQAAMPAVAADMHEMMPMDGRIAPQELQGKGRVVSINATAGTINIAHEPIASLGLPKRAESFDVQDKALLAGLVAGQRVSFRLVEVRTGKYAISEISVIK